MSKESFAHNSVRQLPAGKMQNILQMFESKAGDSSDSASSGNSSPAHKPRKPRPASTFIEGSPPCNDPHSNVNALNPLLVIKPRRPRAKSDVPDHVTAVSNAVRMLESNASTCRSRRDSNPSDIVNPKPPTPAKRPVSQDRKTAMHRGDDVVSQDKKFDIHKQNDVRASVVLKTEEKPSLDSKDKNIPLRPPVPVRPRSRPVSGSSDTDAQPDTKEVNSYCTPWDIGKAGLLPIVPPALPNQPPPRKPPRTGAHDEYLEVKRKHSEGTKTSENKLVCEYAEVADPDPEAFESDDRVINDCQEEEIDDESQMPVYKKIEKPQNNPNANPGRKNPFNLKANFNTEESTLEKPTVKLTKPLRPPPPKSKPIAEALANSERLSEIRKRKPLIPAKPPSPASSLHRRMSSSDAEKVDIHNIRHWDLPVLIKSPVVKVRKSLSAECIPGLSDDEALTKGDPVYIDPVPMFRDDTACDKYLDRDGYAIPYGHKNLDVSKSWNDSSSDTGDARSSKHFGAAVKSKFGELKKFFSPEPAVILRNKTENIDSSKTGKKKLQNVRWKISMAFAVLRTMQKEEAADKEAGDNASDESEGMVETQEIEKRKQHCSVVRKRTKKSIKRKKEMQQSTYQQMFDYGMIVGLEPTDETRSSFSPKVLYMFPDLSHTRLDSDGTLWLGSLKGAPNPDVGAKSNASVPEFCFPDAAEFDSKSASPAAGETYSFVLTNQEGNWIYGYCRRIVPINSSAGLPEVICIISPIDAFSMYNELLLEIEEKRQQSLALAKELISASFGRPMPFPGKSVAIRTLDENGDVHSFSLCRPTDYTIDSTNREILLYRLGSEKLLKIFSCILLERSVLFCAKHLSTLSQTIHALTSLLYPFRWQHVYIPVLPPSMLDVVCSPTPFIIGIQSSQLPKVLELPLSEIVIFDLNKKQLVKCQGDEGTLLPKLVQKALKNVLNMCKIDSDSKGSQNLMMSEAFVRFFLESISHYVDHISVQQDSKRMFSKESFIQDAPSETIKQFLEWFTETQMFEVFITKQIERAKSSTTIESFEKRLFEYKSEQAEFRRNLESGKSKKKIKKQIRNK